MSIEPGLGAVAARGASVSLAGQVARIAVQMAGIAVLARLLTPEDYGLVAMVAVVVALAEIFRDFGLSAAAIRAPTLTAEQRANLFWANTALGAGMLLVAEAVAGMVAVVFREPEVEAILRVMALIFLLNGLATQHRVSLTRDLRFAALVRVDLTSQVLGLAVGVVTAVAGWSYWSLVAMQITQALVALLMVVAAGRWLPGPPRRNASMAGFWRFGWNMVGSQMLSYVSNNADTFVIGRRLGSEPLGLYDRAYRLLVVPLGQVRSPMTTVALPVLSRIAGEQDHERFGRFLRIGQVALGYSIVAGLAAAAGAAAPLIEVFLGSQWEASADIFALLAIGGAIDTLAYVGYWVYLARDLTGRLLQFTVLSTAVRVAAIVVGANWGVMGVAWAYALSRLVLWPVPQYWLSRVTLIPLRALMVDATRILVMAAAGGLLVRMIVTHVTVDLGAVISLGVSGVACAAFYLLAGAVIPAVRRDERVVIDVVRRALARR